MTVPSPACKAQRMILDYRTTAVDGTPQRGVHTYFTEDHDDACLARMIERVLDIDPSASITWEV